MPAHEFERIEALRDLGVLDTPPEERFDRVVRLAQRLFDVPQVAVNLIDTDRQFTKSAVGLPLGDGSLEESFCVRTVQSPGPLVVTDAEHDERFADHPNVTGGLHVRFYAGHPLAAPSGQLVGALCLVSDEPREFSAAEERLLADLSTWVENELANDQQVLQAREIQRRLLPARAVDLAGYTVAGRNLPARHVGGDYYDWTWIDGELQLVVADVMGKGIVAAMVAAGLRATIRGASYYNDLADTIGRSAVAIAEDLMDNGTFVTLFACRLDPVTGSLAYIDAGHGLAVVTPKDGPVRRLSSADLPLGAVPDDTWHTATTTLSPGETLLVVSDGVLDFFTSPAEALEVAAELARHSTDAAALVARIGTLVEATGALDDDVTVLAISREA